MSDPYIGEIRMFGGNFAPVGWTFCNGQLLSISENDTLYALIGTTYGGDGQTTFGVPDLRGRAPLHTSSSYPMGATGGVETVTLTQAQLPAHTHIVPASGSPGTQANPSGAFWAVPTDPKVPDIYGSDAATTMNPAAALPAGGSQSHENMMPFVAVSFIICLQGLFPSQG